MRPMKPREERIRVGGIDVHTWIGGDGAPLLVLHGAGGNRGFTRWAERVAQRFTVWAPTHPGFGLSGDAEWMDGIDDLARFYLWFMDVAGLVRPHVLGHSIGGWTAAEMATMSPGSIDRLILVAPAGLKPETSEILDVFYYPPPQLLPMTVHDPKTVPGFPKFVRLITLKISARTSVRIFRVTVNSRISDISIWISAGPRTIPTPAFPKV